MEILFWSSLLLLFYIFLGYPLIITLLAKIKPRPVLKGDYEPYVSIVFSVYNEEKRLEKRLRNLQGLDYPKTKIEIIVGSDGSSDKTNDILRNTPGIKSLFFPTRRGKPSVLNDLVKIAKGEIIVFADSRQEWYKNSLKLLLRNFQDSKVGVASGLVEEEGNLYRKYENFIRIKESVFSSVPGATGAIYGVRRELFENFPQDIILDDLFLPMKIIRKGYRCIVDEEVLIKEEVFPLKRERARKMRTIAGNFQMVFKYPWMLNPFLNPVWFQFFSHKFLRLFSPLLLLTLFLPSIFLLGKGILYNIFFSLQVIFYLTAFFAKIGNANLPKPFKLPLMFLELNYAIILGFFNLVRGKVKVTWQKGEEI